MIESRFSCLDRDGNSSLPSPFSCSPVAIARALMTLEKLSTRSLPQFALYPLATYCLFSSFAFHHSSLATSTPFSLAISPYFLEFFRASSEGP